MAVRLLTLDLLKRPKQISTLVGSLVSDPKKMQVRRFSAIGEHVVGVVPYGQSPDLVADPVALRIPTFQAGSFFNYHEIWLPIQGTDSYDLNRAYLHVYLKKSVGDTEVQALSLHCDPGIAKASPSYSYKRGPHLHVGGANPNIDRAHIALCVGDGALGGNNVGALMTTFKKSIEMIATEILPCY